MMNSTNLEQANPQNTSQIKKSVGAAMSTSIGRYTRNTADVQNAFPKYIWMNGRTSNAKTGI